MSAPLCLVPGWSFDAAVFGPLRAALGEAVPATAVELPGHGGQADPATTDLAGMVEPLTAEIPDGAVWVGWSLGGTLALSALCRGKPLRGAVLIAATPRFTRADGWPWAVPAEELAAMRAGLARSPAATVRRFRRRLGSVSDADAAAVAGTTAATPAGLAAGLAALAEADGRSAAAGISVPTLWLGGERDPLVPPEAVRRAAAACGGEARILADAGHVPHYTHCASVAQAIRAFVEVR